MRDTTQQYYHSYARSEKSSTYVEMRMMLCGVVDPLSRPNVALFSCSKVKNEDVKRVLWGDAYGLSRQLRDSSVC